MLIDCLLYTNVFLNAVWEYMSFKENVKVVHKYTCVHNTTSFVNSWPVYGSSHAIDNFEANSRHHVTSSTYTHTLNGEYLFLNIATSFSHKKD